MSELRNIEAFEDVEDFDNRRPAMWCLRRRDVVPTVRSGHNLFVTHPIVAQVSSRHIRAICCQITGHLFCQSTVIKILCTVLRQMRERACIIGILEYFTFVVRLPITQVQPRRFWVRGNVFGHRYLFWVFIAALPP